MVRIFRQFVYVGVLTLMVVIGGVAGLRYDLPMGPWILVLAVIPVLGLAFSRRLSRRALPDVCFGAVDTGMLVLPALFGSRFFGVAGAVAGAVIGDALTDAVAGFFEASIAEWLKARHFEESRERITTSLGKMTGCLLGAGVTLTLAQLLGFYPSGG